MQLDFYGVVFLIIINHVDALSLLSQRGLIFPCNMWADISLEYNRCTALTLKTMNEIFEVRQMLAMIWFK